MGKVAVKSGLKNGIRGTTLLLLLFAPLPAGGHMLWARGLFFLAAGILLAGTCAHQLLRRRPLIGLDGFHLTLGLLLLVLAVQLLPASGWLSAVSAHAAERWEEIRQAGVASATPRISLCPYWTTEFAVMLLAAAALYTVLRQLFRDRTAILLLAWGIVGAALINTLLAFGLQADQQAALFWYLEPHATGMVGTYLNRNHFALLQELALPLVAGIGLGTIRRTRGRRHGQSSHTDRSSRDRGLLLLQLASIGVLVYCFAGLLLSYSRAGIAAGILALLLLAALSLVRSRRRHRTMGLWIVGLLMIVGILWANRELFRVSHTYESIVERRDVSGRIRMAVWQDSLRLLGKYWATGVGMGAYSYANPRYERALAPDRVAHHAHNDWLEFLCEVGIPAAALVLGTVILFLFRTGVTLRKQKDRLIQWVGFGALMGLVAVALHEFFDYGLRAPGNMLLAVAAVALAKNCADCNKTANRRARSARKVPAGAAVSLLVAIPLVAAGIAYGVPRYQTAAQLTKLRKQMAIRQKNPDRLSSLRWTEYSLFLANAVLDRLPNCVVALNARGTAAELRARILNRMEASAAANPAERYWHGAPWAASRVAEMSAPERHRRAEALRNQAAKDYARLLRQVPTHAEYQLRYARQLERLETTETPAGKTGSSTALGLYRLAHQSYPAFGSVTYSSAAGILRAALRSSDSPRRRDLIRESIALYTEGLRQSPHRSEDVYPVLWAITPTPAALIVLAPPYIPAQEDLFRFFFDKGRFAACYDVLDTIDRLAETHARLPKGEQGELYEDMRRAARTQPELKLLGRKRRVLLLSMQKRWQERSDALDELSDYLAPVVDEQLRSVRTLVSDQRWHRAALELRDIRQIDPFHPDALLLTIQVDQALGRDKAAEYAFLSLLQSNRRLPPAGLRRAIQMVAPPLASDSPPGAKRPFPVWRFLKAALRLRLANCDSNPAASADLERSRNELTALAESLRDGELQAWLQAPYFWSTVGRMHECSGSIPEAVAAYELALERCPRHLVSAQRLCALTETHNVRSPQEEGARSLLQSLHTTADEQVRLPVNTQFGEIARLLFVEAPATAQRVSSEIMLTYHWLCTGNIEHEYRTFCRFFHNSSTEFHQSFTAGSHGGDDLVTWRIGEVVPVTQRLVPLTTALRQRNRAPSSGEYSMQIQFRSAAGKSVEHRPLVDCRFPVFSLTRSSR